MAAHKAGSHLHHMRHFQIWRGLHPAHVHHQGIELPLTQLGQLQLGRPA